MANKSILIMAGGTGGHIYPALAVATYLQEKNFSLYWLGTKNGLESKIIPARGIKLLTINFHGLRGKGILRWITAPFYLFIAICHAMLILSRYKPAIVLGMGGFVTAPGGFAAWLMRIPLCVHEQNAIAGLSNRFLAPFARIVMQAFPDTFPPSSNAQTTGNPLRREIINIAEPERRFKDRVDDSLRVLVIGGSSGAKVLNETVPDALAILGDRINLQVKHQTGYKNYDTTTARYRSLNISVELLAYIDDMAIAYQWADLILCRAGAMTVAEISAVGLPAIFIPYAYAVDDHQTANARYLSNAGAAILIQESEFNASRLADLLQKLSSDRAHLLKMANLCLTMATTKATEQIADSCMGVAND